MAEVPFDGIYGSAWQRMRVERFGGLTEFVGTAPGPAGIAVVDLPDGSSWAVDFADPASLVSLLVPGAAIADSSLVIAMFGADGAMFLADPEFVSDRHDDGPDWFDRRHRKPGRRIRGFGGSQQRWRGEPSATAGLMVLLADQASDVDGDPLVRLAAIGELLRVLPNVPGSALVDPLVPAYRDEVERLASDAIGDLSIELLSDASAAELRELLLPLAEPAPDGVSEARALATLLDQLDGRASWPGPVAAMMLPSAPDVRHWEPPDGDWPDGEPGAAVRDEDEPEPVLTQLLEVKRLGATLIEVRMALTVYANWASVVRKSDLVTVALIPLEQRKHLRVGQGVIPPDLALDDVEVTFGSFAEGADADDVPDPDEAIRRAIRLGRAASRAARSGDVDRARKLWNDCEAAWIALGDDARADLARDYGYRAGGGVSRTGPPLLAERITAELGVDEPD